MKTDSLLRAVEHFERVRWETFDSHVVKGDGCWEWTGTTNVVTGYPLVTAGCSRLRFSRICYPHHAQWVRYNGVKN